MKINWKVRFKNPVFWVQVILAIAMPVLAYAGLSFEDITTWSILWRLAKNAFMNPYVLGLIVVSVWNSVIDPTTKGFCDSEQALGYTCPKKQQNNT